MRELCEDLGLRLPSGYRARPFEDADREALVEDGNAEAHPMEVESAASWRRADAARSDPTSARVTIVAPDGRVAGTAFIQAGIFQHADASQRAHVRVLRAHRRRGVGTVALDAIEGEARRRGVRRLHAQVSAARPFAVGWASKHGYREIGRRIMSYRELVTYEPKGWHAAIERVEREGITLRSFADVLRERDEAGRERFWREIWEAEAPMWEDIPFASPTPHWGYEMFYELNVKGGELLSDLSIVAYDGGTIAGFTVTGDRDGVDGWTRMTGVARAHRGRGIALALKVAALDGAKAKGLRAMCTVNDEANKAMRGVNVKLGYQAVPDTIELEKTLS